MRDTYKMKYQAIQFYEGWYLNEEGDEVPFCLDHITSEDLYEEFIDDYSDDYELRLLELHRKEN